MGIAQMQRLRTLEGHEIHLSLADGSRIDGANLVSAGRRGTTKLWIYVNGSDAFVPADSVLDAWED